jgi:hypothetical protein
MPSYIELDKQASFPPSSNVGKMIFGIKTNEKVALTDHLGNTTEIGGGGGGTGVVIPQPIILLTGSTNGFMLSQGVAIQFPDTGFDFTSNNPELFLFRWKRGKLSTRTNNFDLRGDRKKYGKWVHPTTQGSETKWEGWKFFNGKQYFNGASYELTGRTTEWSIPSTILPYQIFGIDFNRYMFWSRRFSGSLLEYDTNVWSSGDFTPTQHSSGSSVIGLGMTVNNRNEYAANKQKFALAVAVDNPNATKSNGLCPKIFGPLSEPFYSVVVQPDGLTYSEIGLIKGNHKRHTRVIRSNGL